MDTSLMSCKPDELLRGNGSVVSLFISNKLGLCAAVMCYWPIRGFFFLSGLHLGVPMRSEG